MIRQFVSLHVLAVIAHAACFIYSFSSPTGYDTEIDAYLATVSFQNTQNTYYDVQNVSKIQLPSVVLLHGIVALVTVLFHALFYLPIHSKFATTVWSQGFFALRWVEYSITCTLMTLSSVMSSGTYDFNFVITIIASGIALQLVGCTIEQLKEQWKVLVVIGTLIELSVAWSLVWYTVTSPGMTRYQWIEVVSFLFYYGLFPLNCILDATYRKACFVKTDWTYNVLSITSKFALFWLQVGEVERVQLRGAWPEIQIYGLGMVVPFIGLVLGIYLTPSACNIKNTATAVHGRYWKILSHIATFQLVKGGATGSPKKRLKEQKTRRQRK